MNCKYLIVTIVMATGALCARAQKIPAELSLEKLPQIPVDTISTDDPETKIILYSNNTWSYYRPSLVAAEIPAYSQFWITDGIFAYKSIDHGDLPPVVELNLVSNIKNFKAPVRGKVLSKYGVRRRRSHNGVDIPLKIGEPVCATFEGKVRYAQYNSGGYGYLVILRHSNGLETWHAHLSRLNVAVDDYVKCGQVIGFSGNTGRSRGPHLHFETRYQDQSFDPEFLIDFETGQLKYQTFALEKSFFNINSRASEILEEEDEYDIPLLASDNGEATSSEDILERIMSAQNEKPKTATVSSGNAVYHTVVSGDMLGRLALKYKVSIDQICRLNNMTRETTLRLGKVLRIK